MKRQYFLSLAKKASQKSDHHSHKLGCVITKGNRVIGTGFNTLKTHTRSPHPWRSCHAEFMAVISAQYDIKGATAYIFREHKDGTPALSRPCPSCWKYLTLMGIKKIIYTFEGSFKEEKLK